MLNCIAMFPAINPARGFLFGCVAAWQRWVECCALLLHSDDVTTWNGREVGKKPGGNPANAPFNMRSATVQAGRIQPLPSLRASSTALPLAGGPHPFTAGKNRLGRSDPKPVCLGGLALCSVTTRPWSVPPQAGQGISFALHRRESYAAY